MFMSITHRWNN